MGLTLFAQVSEDLKQAMKAQAKDKVQVLRMLLSELKYAKAQTNVHADLSDNDTLKVMQSYYKKLEKSLSDYPDGAQKSAIQSEMAIVAHYLPQKASRDDVEKALAAVLQESSERNFGIVMKAVMTKLGSAADGKLVSEVVKASLGS